MTKLSNLEGEKFGRLLVLDLAPKIGKRVAWNCLCECGNKTVVMSCNLTTEHTQSCGCYKKERMIEGNITHGKRWTPEYAIWCKIKARCYNPSTQRYPNYGGRGIKMEGSWPDSFESFYEDMGPRPSEKHTIERVDVNKNYSKYNCIWTDDLSLQVFNQTLKSNNTSGRTGVYLDKKSGGWRVSLGKDYKTYYYGTFKTIEEAIEVVEKAEIELYGTVRSNFK